MARDSIPLADGAGTETTLGMLLASGSGTVARTSSGDGDRPRRGLLDLDIALLGPDERD